METQTKRRVTVFATVLLGIAYFLVFSTPLPKTLNVRPIWASAIPPSLDAPARKHSGDEKTISFEIGDRYGYFDAMGGVRFSRTRGFGVSITDSGYVAWEREPGDLTFRDTAGTVVFVSKQVGYPFMDGDRRFVLSSNQSGVAELGPGALVLWKRDFPSILTAFSSNENLAVFGTADGQLFAIDRSGKEWLSFAPGGSRIACIYGCAVSPDGKTIAAISGLDRQRIVILEKREESYRVTWHRWMDSDFRRPVAMSFTFDGKELVFESASGLGVYDVGSRKQRVLGVSDTKASGSSIPSRSLLLALDNGPQKSILVASYDGKKYLSIGYGAFEATLRASGDSLFLGLRDDVSSQLLRLDLVEE